MPGRPHPLKRPPIVIDAPLAALIGLLWVTYGILRWAWPKRRRTGPPRLLVLDTSYSLATLRARNQLHSVTCRDLGAFFDHVWTCYPLAGADPEPPATPAFGKVHAERIAPRHTFITGHAARWRALAPLRLTNFLLAQFALFRFLDRLVGRQGIRAIRVGDPFYPALFGLALARLHRVPIALRAGAPWDKVWANSRTLAYPTLVPSYGLQKRIDRFTLPRMDLVAGTNQDNLAYAVSNGARPDRGTLFPYGGLLDPAHFEEPHARPSATQDLRDLGVESRGFVLYVARLERLKYHEDALHAFAHVRARRPGLKLVFVGDGTQRAPLAALAGRLGVAEAVVLAGPRDQAWLARVLPHALVLLALSAGRALVEAALSGRPVVAYDFEWHREAIDDGNTGMLVPFRDVDALGAALRNLLSNPLLADRLGRAGRARALRDNDPARLLDHERTQYQRILSPTKTPTASGL